jgi:two-component system, NarL family, response regulator NreC
MNKKHRVLLCDDQDIFRWSVREVLKHQADIQVVGEASGGQAGIDAALELLPDLVLMDVSMPDVNGLEATRQIVAKAPAVKVLAHSSQSSWETVDQMFAAGARGYVLKQGDGVELVRAIRTVLAGGSFLSPGLLGDTTPVEEET